MVYSTEDRDEDFQGSFIVQGHEEVERERVLPFSSPTPLYHSPSVAIDEAHEEVLSYDSLIVLDSFYFLILLSSFEVICIYTTV